MVSTRGNKFKFTEGEKVLCYEPDPSNAKVLYDSKILECLIVKGGKGRKVAKYKIHFNGWNSSWDRLVSEEFILHDTEESRDLQRQLFEEATQNLKNTAMKRKGFIEKRILKRGQRKRLSAEASEQNTDNSVTSDVGSSSEKETTKTMSFDEEEEEEVEEEFNVELDIPDRLKQTLMDDKTFIKKKNKLVRLPCKMNIISIFESYVKDVGVSVLCELSSNKPKSSGVSEEAEIKIRLCKEIMDGLRIYFDFMLRSLLLYNEEHAQYNAVMILGKPKPPISVEAKAELKRIKKETHVCPEPPSKQQSKAVVASSTSVEMTRTYPLRHGHVQHSKTVRYVKKIKMEPTESSESLENDLKMDVSSKEPRRRRLRSSTSDSFPIGTSSKKLRKVPRKRLLMKRSTLTESRNEPASRGRKPRKKIKNERDEPARSSVRKVGRRKKSSVESSFVGNKDSNKFASKNESATSAYDDAQSKLKSVLQWKLIPDYVYEKYPVMPCSIYGAVHLLRLFVKLPSVLKRINMEKALMRTLLQYITEFLSYMDDRREELFPRTAYMDVPNGYPDSYPIENF